MALVMMCRRFIFISLGLLFSAIVLARQEQSKFRHISFKEGLAQSPIACIFQDKQGFIWIGNWKGLTRYDGNEFRNFKHSDAGNTSLSNNRVNGILQDEQENMWIATANGISIFNPKSEKFRSIISVNVKGGKNYISSVISDEHRRIWVSTFGGVKLIRNYKLLDIHSFNKQAFPDLYNGVVFTLFKDNRNFIWAGTKHGPAYFDPVSLKVLDLPQALKTNISLMKAKVLVIKQDKTGNIWFGTESSGVFKYNPASNTCIQYKHSEGDRGSLCSDWIKDILIARDGNIWIGTRGGISVWQGENRFLNYIHEAADASSMNDSTVWSLMQDSSLNVWIGTFAGGINLLYNGGDNFLNIGERIGNKPGLNHPVVNAVAEDPDGSFWIGTYGGGINHINLKTGVSQYYSVRLSNLDRPTNGVKSLYQDNNDNLWIGTLDGLYRFNKKTHAIKSFSFPVDDGKLSGNLINTILVDKNGIWAGTNGGGLRFISNDGVIKTYRHTENDTTSLSDNFVTCLIKDDEGNIWIATQNGLNYFDAAKQKFTVRFKRKGFPLSHNTILTLFIDSKKLLWIGTEGGGLNYFDRAHGKIYSISSSNGLSDDVVHSVQEDKTGNIWASTDNGIFKIHTGGSKPPFNPSSLKVTHYSSSDGLASNQFSTNAGLCTNSGLMLFGGVNGLTMFKPESLVTNRFVPAVVLTALYIRNNRVPVGTKRSPLIRAVNYTNKITLNYNERFISINFAALNFINPANNKYAYKLEGLTNTEDWHFAGNHSSATYTNLGPGSYTFMVKAANNDGIWNEIPAVLKITVLPPWWMTWWAYLLYTLTIAFIILAIIRFFRIRAKLKRELFYEQLQNERQQELYQMKLNFFTNISHEIRTPLTLITGPLEKLINTIVDSNGIHRQLILIKNNADRLMRLVSELLDFRKIETGHMKLHFSECNLIKFTEEIFLSFQSIALNRNIDYEFDAKETDILVCFDKSQMEKVLFNLLSNAFKFTPDSGSIKVSVKRESREDTEWADVIVTDNGKGISSENQSKLFNNFFQADDSKSHLGTGIGLALSKSIVELHQGELSVSSIPSSIEGESGKTDFTVSLRTGKEHIGDNELIPEYMNSDNLVHYQIQSEVKTIIESEKPKSKPKRYSILIVEDNAEVRSFISSSLNDSYFVHESPDGLRGLEDAFNLMPDLIISDVMMPGMDGLELCRTIKSDERTNHIPVIMLTARATYIHQVNGLENGADAYITKPFSIHILELHIRNILESKEVIRKKYSREIILQPKNITISSPEEKFLQKLMEIVERNIENDQFGVQELVDEIGMSKTVLYKKVQSLTGLSIADFVKSVRLKKAAMMLKQNKTGISEVAFAVGFNDRKYFSKEFRKQYGISPTEYINQEEMKPAEERVS